MLDRAASGPRTVALVLAATCLLSATDRRAGAAEPTLLERKTLLHWPGGDGMQGGPPSLDEPLASDRPDFTEASSTVGRGIAQLEAGYTFIQDRSGGTEKRAHSFPEALLRVGVLADWLELRVGQNFAKESSRAIDLQIIENGAKDLYLGTKIMLTPQDVWLPAMAVIPQMRVPTGSDDFSDGKVLPGMNWLYSWGFEGALENLTTGGSTQLNRMVDPENETTFVSVATSWTVGYALTDHFGSYAELFGIFPDDDPKALPEGYFDGGFTYLVTNDFQLDVRAGAGLNGAADNFFTGAGFVLRLPWDCDLW